VRGLVHDWALATRSTDVPRQLYRTVKGAGADAQVGGRWDHAVPASPSVSGGKGTTHRTALRNVCYLSARDFDQLRTCAWKYRVRELLDLTPLLTGVRRRSRHVWQRLNPNREVRVEP